MRGGLDLSRESCRRLRFRRLAGWAAAAVCAGGLVLGLAGLRLPAMAAGLPGQLAGCLRTAAAQQLFALDFAQARALEKENRALRTRVAAAAPLAAENAALRQALGCLPADTTRCRALCRAAGSLGGKLYLTGEKLPAGTALLDPGGHFAGIVTGRDRGGCVAALAGKTGCQILCTVGAAGDVGVLAAKSGGLYLTELPRHTAAAAGDAVSTLGGGTVGLWVGCLAAVPAADPGGLTCSVPLTDTAANGVFCYFAVENH